jgi:single-strand DNA-binding protein
MASLNKVLLIGNLTRDAELRVTPKGTSVAQFGLAVNRKFKKEDNTDGEEVTFVDIEAWGKQAELVAKYLTKGSPAMVEGRLKFEQWEDKQSGQKRSKLKVILENVQFLSTRGGAETEGGGGGKSREGGAPVQSNGTPASLSGVLDEANVPF